MNDSDTEIDDDHLGSETETDDENEHNPKRRRCDLQPYLADGNRWRLADTAQEGDRANDLAAHQYNFRKRIDRYEASFARGTKVWYQKGHNDHSAGIADPTGFQNIVSAQLSNVRLNHNWQLTALFWDDSCSSWMKVKRWPWQRD
jgi:hypothetical protein